MKQIKINSKHTTRWVGIGVMALLLLAVVSFARPAVSSKAAYTIDRSSLHSYGSSHGCDDNEKSLFTVNGTKGQPEVWPELSDSKLDLQGGFGANWHVPSKLDCDAVANPTATPSTPSPTVTPDPLATPAPTGTPDDPNVFDTIIFLPIIER